MPWEICKHYNRYQKKKKKKKGRVLINIHTEEDLAVSTLIIICDMMFILRMIILLNCD